MLPSLKDKVPSTQKSGIYKIDCQDCSRIYIGQTKRSIETRFKEHLAHLKYGRTEKSAVAEHAVDNDHRVGSAKLLKSVNGKCLEQRTLRKKQ